MTSTRETPDELDDAAIEAQFGRRPMRRTTKIALGLALVAGLGAAITWFVLRPAPYEALDSRAPERTDAFRRGGRPAHDAVIREALATELPKLTAVATAAAIQGQDPSAQLAEVGEALRARPLASALGEDAAFALGRLVGAFDDHVAGSADLDAVRAAARRFDAALEARNLGYRVHVLDLGTTVAGLLTFEIREVEPEVRTAAGGVRVMLVDRLDALALESGSFGYVDPVDRVVAIPVDAADRWATTVLLPLLEEPPFPSLADPRSTADRFPFLPPTHASAGALAERSLGPARCGADVREAVRLLAARRALLLTWTDLLLARGGPTLVMPDRYAIELERWRLFRNVPRHAEFERLHRELGESAPSRGFACARDAFVAAQRPGLVQRFVDARRREPWALPASVLAFVDDRAIVEARTNASLEGRVTSVRATLASMAADDVAPGLPLIASLRCMTDGGRCLRDGEDACRIVVAELGRELGLPSRGEPHLLGPVQVTDLFRALSARSDAELRGAASSAFRRLFGDAPVSLGMRSGVTPSGSR